MEGLSLGKARYEVFGPFPFNTAKGLRHRTSLRDFWQERTTDSPKGLSEAIGVYVWTIKQRGRRVPWNVGMTAKGFQKRFPNKEATFLRLLMDKPDAEIEVYLLARRSKAGKFSKTSQTRLSNWLETMLIGASIGVNSDLYNKAKSKFLRTTVVDGYLNDDKEGRSGAAKSFNALFGTNLVGKRKHVSTG